MSDEETHLDKFLKDKPEEEQRFIRHVFEVLNGYSEGTHDTCVHCGQQITGMKQVGREVVGLPCGHRLSLGRDGDNSPMYKLSLFTFSGLI